uniref:Uncharacterized protein n=1 Tax=Rhizophora mucronata TaxID=61149 RepID=A0A2P2P3G2_RHIMU
MLTVYETTAERTSLQLPRMDVRTTTPYFIF